MLTRPGIRAQRLKIAPHEGMWDFDGACKPGAAYAHQQTFSVGVFQWLAKSSAHGLKRGKTVKRISGPTHAPEAVYGQAEAFCLGLEAAAKG